MKNIILCGYMGSGKSVIGKMLAEKLKASFYDTDKIIEKEQNMKIPEIFQTFGEEYFRNLETKTIKSFLGMNDCVISLGGGLAANHENHPILSQLGIVICLDCGIEETLKRISGDKGRPLALDGNRAIIDRYNERKFIYEEVADITIDSSRETTETLNSIISKLEELRII